MMDLLGCTVTQQHFAIWASLLVSDPAPFFLSGDMLSLVPTTLPIMDRRTGLAHYLPRPFHDSYAVYTVDPACQHVVFLTDTALRELPAPVRETLLATQWRYGRGQIYDWAYVKEMLPANLPARTKTCIETDSGTKWVLDASLWHALSPTVREHWLRHFIEQEQPSYPFISLGQVPHLLESLPPGLPLANTFTYTSGPNCFATTLAAITNIPAYAETISTLWLEQQAFVQGLHIRGYTTQETVIPEDRECHEIVILWRDAQAVLRHACFLLGEGVALNKNAQAWYTPRHLALLHNIVRYWEEDNYQIEGYTQSGR